MCLFVHINVILYKTTNISNHDNSRGDNSSEGLHNLIVESSFVIFSTMVSLTITNIPSPASALGIVQEYKLCRKIYKIEN